MDADALLALNLSDSEPEEAANPNNTTNNTSSQTPTSEPQPTRAERTALSESAFQALKQSYRPKVENGNIHTTIPLPLPASPSPLPKPDAQALLHAAEELYFFRRYAEAASFLWGVLGAESAGRIDGETRRLLGYYEERCRARVEEQRSGGNGGQGEGVVE